MSRFARIPFSYDPVLKVRLYVCTECKKTLPETDYYKDPRTARYTICRECFQDKFNRKVKRSKH